jgi:cytochrome c oxidase subunit 2
MRRDSSPEPAGRARRTRSVRRQLLALTVLACVLALGFATAALAGNGGLTPPTPESPNAGGINASYNWIAIFTGAIFLIVEGALIVFIVRFRGRGRPRSSEGPQIRGHTRLEIIWTVIPVLILAAIGSFVFYKLPGIQDPPKATAASQHLPIKIEAHQFYWQFTYPNGEISIDELHVPVNRVATVDIHSQDVDHSWWIPQMGGKMDAIPGKVNHTWFRPRRTGTFKGQCAEFCGIFHATMNARVIVTSQAEYDQWLNGPARTGLGKSEFEGVCAKCHGMGGKGAYGPALTTNPLIAQRAGLETVITQGVRKMPPVARGWSKEQLDALYAYITKSVYKGASTSGASAGAAGGTVGG